MNDVTTVCDLATVRRYYAETYFDYRSLWLNRRNLAFHFGCHDSPGMTHAESLERSNELLADIARVSASDMVLDAGCGLGGSSCWLARVRGASAVGIALGTPQMKKATLAAQRKGLSEKVSFLCADFERTPFAASTFDVIWAQESLCHAIDKAAFYREAWRLLRPGGRIVVAEFMRTDRVATDTDAALLQEWLDGWAMPGLETRPRHAAAAGAAGFANIVVRDTTESMRPSLRYLYRWSRIAWTLAWTLQKLGLRSAVQHGNVVAARRQWEALMRELWFYGILSAVKS